MDTSLVLKSIDPKGDLLRKVFTYVNPEVSNSDLKEFALKANALTENIYKAAFRVIKMSVDEEWQSGTQKPTPSLVFGMDEVSLRGGDQFAINYAYDGDAKFLYSYADPNSVDYKLDLVNQQVVLTAPEVVSVTQRFQFRIYSPRTTHFADKEYFFKYILVEGQPQLPTYFSPEDILNIFTDEPVSGGFDNSSFDYIFDDDLPTETAFSVADMQYIFDEVPDDTAQNDIDYIFSDGTVQGGFSSTSLNYVFDDSTPVETALPAADINYIFD